MSNSTQVSKFGSKFETKPDWVPDKNNRKGIIAHHDQIDELTQDYLKNLGAILGVDIKEIAHYDSSSAVRDLALSQLEDEFPRQLPELDFDF